MAKTGEALGKPGLVCHLSDRGEEKRKDASILVLQSTGSIDALGQKQVGDSQHYYSNCWW